MGLGNVLKSLGHIVPVIGPVIDAIDGYGQPDPNAAPNLTNILGNLGKVGATTAQGSANGRFQEGELNQGQDRNAIQQYLASLTGANTDLAQRKYALTAPSIRANQSVQGDTMANARDATVSGLPDYIHVGQVSGGLRPSLFSGHTRALGTEMSRKALADQMHGDTFAPLPTPPALTPLPQANGFDKTMGAIGIGGSLAGALGPAFRPSPSTAPKATDLATNPQGPIDQPDWTRPQDVPSEADYQDPEFWKYLESLTGGQQ